MTEILTESFCERCGTRYTFESAAPRKSRLGRVRVVSKGLRNFVMQDESTLSEAMADARSDEERAATAHQLDAFHKTFNFCMTCRQYTCGNCWNTVEGRCLTCAPVPGMELAETVPAGSPAGLVADGVAAAAADAAPEAWPEADLAPDRLARAMGIAGVAAAGADGPAPGDQGAAGEVVAAGHAAGDESIAAPGDAGPAAEAPSGPQVIGLAPGQSLEEALAAYEAEVAAAELDQLPEAGPQEPALADAAIAAVAAHETVEAVAEHVEAEAVETEGAIEVSEPARADLEPGPAVAEPDAHAAEVEAAAEPEPEAAAVDVEPEAVEAAVPARDDIVEQPTWPVAAATEPAPPEVVSPPAPEPVANPWLTVAPDDGAAPQWPAAAGWSQTAGGRELPTTLAGRPLLPRDNAADLWAASAREVLSGGPAAAGPTAVPSAAPATPQPCVSCGLSLSANARFCRRCGSRQG